MMAMIIPKAMPSAAAAKGVRMMLSIGDSPNLRRLSSSWMMPACDSMNNIHPIVTAEAMPNARYGPSP